MIFWPDRNLFCPGTDTAVAADAATKGATDAAAAGATEAAGTGLAADTALTAAGADAAAAGAAGGGALGAGEVGVGVGAAGEAVPEITISATPLAAEGAGALPAALGAGAVGAGLGAGLAPSGAGATSPSAIAPPDASGTPTLTVQADPLAADVGGTPLETSVAPALFAGLGDPLQSTGGVAPMDPTSDPSSPDFIGPTQSPLVVSPSDLATDPGLGEAINAAPEGGQSWWDQALKTLKTPKGALGAGLLASNLYGMLNRPSIPGAARTALGAAGPAVAQAQSVIQTGGMGTPLWTSQKSAIDASIDQQIKDLTASIMQTAANQGEQGPGVNSGVVQEQIASMKARLNTERVQLYDQALQMNVNNAISELTGANQTLMGVANLELQADQYAQQLARDIGITSGELFGLWPARGG